MCTTVSISLQCYFESEVASVEQLNARGTVNAARFARRGGKLSATMDHPCLMHDHLESPNSS